MKKPSGFGILLCLSVLIAVSCEAGPSQKTAARQIAITIDDLPVNWMTDKGIAGWEKITAALLDSLKEHGVPAIGFVNLGKLYGEGGKLEPRRLALLTQWLEAGFELGNHTFSHLDLHKTCLPDFMEDLLRDEDILRDLCEKHGASLEFFRHPLLHTGLDIEIKHGLERTLKELGYRIAPVTMDNSEWLYARAFDIADAKGDNTLKQRIAAAYLDYMEQVISYYESQSSALFGREIRQILLIHANTLNSEYFRELALILTNKGYQFISLAEALEDEAYTSEDSYTGSGGITWLHRWALTQGKRGDFFQGEPEVDEFVNAIYQGKY